jgi:hypothetical protein
LKSGSSRNKSANKDLLQGCHDDNRWRRHFVPTLFKFIGIEADPFAVADGDIVITMQKIWKKVYGKRIEHTITVNDIVFRNVSIPFSQKKALNNVI